MLPKRILNSFAAEIDLSYRIGYDAAQRDIIESINNNKDIPKSIHDQLIEMINNLEISVENKAAVKSKRGVRKDGKRCAGIKKGGSPCQSSIIREGSDFCIKHHNQIKNMKVDINV